MGRNRFVPRKTKRIDISDGDWIDVKEQLNIAELMNYFGWHKIESARTYLRLGEMNII